MSRKRSIVLFLFLACLLTIGLASNRTGIAAAQSDGVVISQVYGGGGNSGATLTNDFIELFNAGTTAVDISGWSVQYASTSGTSWQVTSLSGTLQPGQYYLIQQAAGAGGTDPLPTPDATGSIAMAATNGKVALVNNSTALSGSCPTDGVVDFVGFGSANCFEGSGATPTLSNTTAALRLDDGCQDTDDNAADFVTGAPTPRNTASPLNVCEATDPPDPPATIVFALWDFDDSTTNATIDLAGSAAAAAGSGLGDENFFSGYPNFTGLAWSFNNWGLGSSPDPERYFEFKVNLTNYANVDFFFAERRSGTGPLTFEIHYSTNGMDFTLIPETVTTMPANTSFHTFSFDFGANTAVNDAISGQPEVWFRIYGYGASGAGGTWRIDDVTFSGVEAAPEPLIVISQVYGGGGNSGAPLNRDYVELFNRGTTAVDITDWSLQYTSANGNSWGNQKTALSGVIEPGQYYLVQLGGGTTGEPLPTPDAIGTTNMAAGSGKIVLVSSFDSLPAEICPTGDTVVDFVGYGNVNCAEGGNAAPTLSNTTAAFRADGGCQDTDDNAADFTAGSPAPRNSASPLNVCLPPEGDILSVSKTGPAIAVAGDTISYELVISNVASNTDAENVVITDTLPAELTFVGFSSSSAVTLVSGDAPDIVWAVDALPAGADLTITLDVAISDTFAAATTNTVVVASDTPETVLDNNSDTAVTSPPVGGSCGQPFMPIYDIQGSGLTAAITGPVTTEGVVIGDYEGPQPNLRGFYIQDPVGDGDPETSDGIFIFNFNNDDVNLGDAVRVSGMAGDFQGQTQISGVVTLLICDTDQTIEPTEVHLPFPEPVDGVPYLERYEGMLVRLPQTLYVTEHFQLGRFGQIVMSFGDRLYQPTNLVEPGPAALALQAQNDLNRIIIDDELNNQNPDPILFGRGGNELTASNTLRGGDTAENIVGVMTFTWAGNAASGNAYRVRPINALGGGVPDFQPANPRPNEPEDVGGTLKVAAFNVLNYFNTFSGCTNGVSGGPTDCRGADNQFEFDRQWPKTVDAILGMDVDVLGVIEIENAGYGPDSAIQDLVNRLNDATAPGTYAFVDADAETDEIDALGTDAIKVALLYRPANVTPVGQTAVLNTESFITGGDANPRNRATIAQAFEQNDSGARFIVNVHHLKSKGSACEDPDLGDGQGNCAVVRTNAVLELMEWLYTDPTGTGETDILIMGDLNSYAKEDPIQAILEFGFVNLAETLIGPESYSYVFDGQWGNLDYMLASPTLAAQVTGITEWHINADEPNVLDYNTNFKSANHVEILYAPNQFRSSDHDPILVGLDLLHYEFDGFFPPVNNAPEFNQARAGRSIPIKFSLNGDQGLDIFFTGYPISVEIDCQTGDVIGTPVSTFSNSGLNYSAGADEYNYVWQTDQSWSNSCRQFTLGLNDGSQHILYFNFR
jgi:uncharacterized protein